MIHILISAVIWCLFSSDWLIYHGIIISRSTKKEGKNERERRREGEREGGREGRGREEERKEGSKGIIYYIRSCTGMLFGVDSHQNTHEPFLQKHHLECVASRNTALSPTGTGPAV